MSARLDLRWLAAAALVLLAFGVRIAFVARTPYRVINDAGSYLTLASDIAHTGDYSGSHAPGKGAGGTRGPSAYFAPGFPYLLAFVDTVDGHAVRRGPAIQPARYAQAALGAVTVAAVGAVAFEAFGGWLVALIAMAVAAVYPVLVEVSGTLVAENLLTPLVLGAVWAALRARRSPGRAYAWLAGAGALTGLATLTHENAVLLVLPLGWAAWRIAPRRPLGLGLFIACTVLCVLPWTIRNAVVMHDFIPVSDETGITLVGTYNRASAANPVVPYKWRLYYAIPGERKLIRQAPHLSEPALGSRLQHQALSYIGHHPGAPFAVIYHNTRRLFELEGSFAWHASAAAIGLRIGTARIGVISFWVVCLLALLGCFTRAVRLAPKWLWWVPVLLALSVVLVNVETPRFREPVDPFLVLLAGCALGALAVRLQALVAARGAGRLLGGAPVRGGDDAPLPAADRQPVEMRQRLT